MAWPPTATGEATPAALATHVQSHWTIEVLYWIRDTLWREDNSKTRTRSGPRVRVSLRATWPTACSAWQATDITEAGRWDCRNMTRPFIILGFTP